MKYGIISDIHEDVVRLKEALNILEEKKVDEIICLGDMVGFSVPYYTYWETRSSNEVVNIVRAECSVVVIGNHDLNAIQKLPHHKDFFDYPTLWYALDYDTRKMLSNNKVWLYDNDLPSCLSDKNKEYIASLPEYVVKDMGDHNVLLSHYAYPDLTGSAVEEIKDIPQLGKNFHFMSQKNCVYGFSANDHYEGVCYFTRENKGSIGFCESLELGEEPLWLHGPTVSRGEFHNGILIYDSKIRVMESIPLKSKTHRVIGEWIKFDEKGDNR
ncbi:metallophosphoesterase family protein [[Clostridium] polysaccharolyticum]|uniref:Calcineurin-like phosphoesterase superfamily domain-containing protein n=1 Tax=[Clostridium] polysaccharolyticum TaxID=29364 RepID=A0A1I0G1A3_9FIRM|nr:metallophosphoesterase family protein [[Clostridium] polysaccharolyticum]SET64658.1 Calcineurin-like phosphoesterase superfamily domain-containing protein [[Clostridium] polysaccharolyticum]